MKNASKALIITGIILIIVLTLVIVNFSKNKSNSSIAKKDTNEFNKEFVKYEGEILGSKVVELLDKVISNASKNQNSDDKLPDLIYINEDTEEQIISSDSNDINLNNIGILRSSLDEKHYYKIDFHNNKNTDLIDYILIKY